jgi:hypothetical protein
LELAIWVLHHSARSTHSTHGFRLCVVCLSVATPAHPPELGCVCIVLCSQLGAQEVASHKSQRSLRLSSPRAHLRRSSEPVVVGTAAGAGGHSRSNSLPPSLSPRAHTENTAADAAAAPVAGVIFEDTDELSSPVLDTKLTDEEEGDACTLLY